MRLLSLILGILFFSECFSQHIIYLIPGHGSDCRIFSKIDFPEGYNIVHMEYELPGRKESMKQYAVRLSSQIEDGDDFTLIGVSLGGMLAVEIAEIKNPKRTIIISSAKNRNELPGRYRFQRKIPIYKMVGPRLAKAGAKILQPLVEPDRNKEKETFKSMLNNKDRKFIKRAIHLIITWKRETNSAPVTHIHGSNDHTIPHRNVKYDTLVKGGSHMMTLTRPEEISKIITGILLN